MSNSIRELKVTMVTSDIEDAGSDAGFFLEFHQHNPKKSIQMPNLPHDEREAGATDTYRILDPDLKIEDFEQGYVRLRNDNTGNKPGWYCKSLFITAIDEDGNDHSLVDMPDVHRWLAASEPAGLEMVLDISNQ